MFRMVPRGLATLARGESHSVLNWFEVCCNREHGLACAPTQLALRRQQVVPQFARYTLRCLQRIYIYCFDAGLRFGTFLCCETNDMEMQRFGVSTHCHTLPPACLPIVPSRAVLQEVATTFRQSPTSPACLHHKLICRSDLAYGSM